MHVDVNKLVTCERKTTLMNAPSEKQHICHRADEMSQSGRHQGGSRLMIPDMWIEGCTSRAVAVAQVFFIYLSVC